jgi:hypothetical protein
MPKVQIDFRPGSPINEEWQAFLSAHFEPKSLERLERLGGRLTVSLTIPLVPKDHRIKSPIVDDKELAIVRELTKDKGALQRRLDMYDVKNLRRACEQLGIAVSKKIPRIELIAEIVRSLNSDSMWEGIRHPPEPQE